jgi:Ca2+-transporting ATPase
MTSVLSSENRKASYRGSADAVLSAFNTNAQLGLSNEEAVARRRRYGRNELAADNVVPAWRKLLAQFQNVLVILLLTAALISAVMWILERGSALPYEAIAILAIVLLNALMGYTQQARAEQALTALRQMSAPHANVVRNGVRESIVATDVVPGDVLLIEEGDIVTADARLFESSHFRWQKRR